jgi:hypothetical protein
MVKLPQPVTTTDFLLVALLEKLEEIRCGLIDVEGELQRLNNAATQKPQIALDVDKLATKIIERTTVNAVKRGK